MEVKMRLPRQGLDFQGFYVTKINKKYGRTSKSWNITKAINKYGKTQTGHITDSQLSAD